MRWRINSEGPNQMHEASLVEQESYEKIQELTFSTSFAEDEQRLREFWSFYLDSEITIPQVVSRKFLIGPTNDEEGLEDIFLGPIF